MTTIPFSVRNRFWWLALLLVWAAVVGYSLNLQIGDLKSQSIKVAAEGARNMFRMVVLTRQWNASHGGIYVPVSPRSQPNPYLDHPRRDVQTTDGQAMTLINPAYMTRLIAEMALQDSGAVFHITSLRPIRPENVADPWEKQILQSFEAGEKEALEIVTSPEGGAVSLRYMAPLLVKKSCMQCHQQQGYKIGDVRGGISVTQDYLPIQEATAASIQWSLITHGLVFVLVAGLGWFLLESLRRRWIDLVENIAELEATRNELLQSEKMASLGRVVAGFAHEINTPIGIAVGAVSQGEETLNQIEALLEQEEVEEEALRSNLKDLNQGGALALANLRRAAQLVQSFKRTAIDQASDQVRLFHMRELIDDVLNALRNQLKRLPIAITVICDEDIAIKGVPGLLEQVLTNMILNAVHHAFDDGDRAGQITIRVSRQGSQLRMTIIDDGKGMSEESVSQVFEPFFTSRRGEGGSGLGLYICYNIITSKLGGSLVCESQPDKGCVMDMTFPADFSLHS